MEDIYFYQILMKLDYIQKDFKLFVKNFGFYLVFGTDLLLKLLYRNMKKRKLGLILQIIKVNMLMGIKVVL
jgi:hypothetical protein